MLDNSELIEIRLRRSSVNKERKKSIQKAKEMTEKLSRKKNGK